MAKVCARPGCVRPATARFAFDARNRLVVIDARVAEWGGSGVLCTVHADGLRPMRGWKIDDRRDGDPRLFPVARERTAPRPAPRSTDEQHDDLASVRGARARKVTTPAPHHSTPLPLDGGTLYALPEGYLAAPEATDDDATTTIDAGRPGGPALDELDGSAERRPDEGHDEGHGDIRPGSGSLLARAFDAAGSRVRADSTLGNLIPRTALG